MQILKKIEDSERNLYESVIRHMGYNTGYSLRSDKRNEVTGEPTDIELCYEGEDIKHDYFFFILEEKREK